MKSSKPDGDLNEKEAEIARISQELEEQRKRWKIRKIV